MEHLEELIKQAESDFISTVTGILSQPCSNRFKIMKLYREYVNTMSAVSIMVSEAKLVTPPAGSVTSNKP